MSEHDYLWDPRSEPIAEIETLERALKPFSSGDRGLAGRTLSLPRRSSKFLPWQRILPLAAAASVVFVAIYGLQLYRLSWPDGSPWPIASDGSGRAIKTSLLNVGERIVTTSEQTVTLNAARIGKVVIAPNSAIQLLETQKGRHRIELEYGHVHAKVWAPPSYFGVNHGETRILDMGCEFDLNIEPSGRGSISVSSGWVIYRRGNKDGFVPEHYSLEFDNTDAQLPTRIDAERGFRDSANELEVLVETNSNDQARVIELTQTIAVGARDEDYFTLLTLLNRYPKLALSPLYPRLAKALHANAEDEQHRARWAQGDVQARSEWWEKLPKQPKQSNSWWWNWRDAF